MSRLRLARTVVLAYAALSVLTVVALAILSKAAPSQVDAHAWVRGVIIAATSLLLIRFAAGALAGDARMLLRLRIVVAILLVAVVAVLFFLSLPAWMVIEQAACAVLLAVVALLIFDRTAADRRRWPFRAS